jgi:plastocyanin
LQLALPGLFFGAFRDCADRRRRLQHPLTPELLGATSVIIQNFSFQPAQVSVKQGGKSSGRTVPPLVTHPHTSTADGGAWSSPPLNAGTTFGHTFDQAGTFPYHCEPHPSMTGSVVVEP